MTKKNGSIMTMCLVAIIVLVTVYSGVYKIHDFKVYPPVILCTFGFIILLVKKTINRNILIDIVIASLVLMLAALSSLINGEVDSCAYILRYVVKAIYIPALCSVTLFWILIRFDNVESLLLHGIMIALVTQLVVVISQLSFPEFRAYFFQFVELSDNWRRLADVGHFRATGLAGLSIYDTSVSYALLVIPYIRWCNSKSLSENIKFIFISVVSSVLAIISGRTGFLILLTYFLLCITFSKRWILYYMSLLMMVASILAVISFIIGVEELYNFSRFAFEPIYAYIETGNFSSASTDELMNSYLFIPWDTPLLTGFGVWAQPSISEVTGFKYMTDSGVILFFIFMGLPGLILVCLYFVNFINGVKFSYDMIYRHVISSEGKNRILVSLEKVSFVFVMLFFFSGLLVKSPFIFSERIMASYFILIVYSALLRFKRHKTLMDIN